MGSNESGFRGQVGSRSHLGAQMAPSPIQARFLVDLGPKFKLGAKLAPKTISKRCRKQNEKRSNKILQRGGQDGPKQKKSARSRHEVYTKSIGKGVRGQSISNAGHLQKKLRKNPRVVGMKKEEEKAAWKKLVYPIWRVL